MNQLKKLDLPATLSVEERSAELYVFLRHKFPAVSNETAADVSKQLEEAFRLQFDSVLLPTLSTENVRLNRELSELRTKVKGYDACVVHNSQLEQQLARAWGRTGILMVLSAGLSAILTSFLR